MSGPGRYLFLIVIGAFIAVAVVLGLLRGLTGNDAGGPGMGPRGPVPVVVEPVSPRDFVDGLEALGTTQANESVTITAQVTETVRRVGFEDGQAVEAGDILVELTDEEEAADLAEARATLLQATQQYDRIADLVRQGNATKASLDEQIALRDQANARVRAVEARIADRLIRAPFEGILGLRSVSVGTLVTPGTVITTLDQINPIKLDFAVPETFFSVVTSGQMIQATSDAFPDQDFEGEITAVDSRINPETRAVIARALIRNDDRRLRPGMLMRVDIEKNRRTSLSVPEEAIVPLAERVYVFRIAAEDTVERVEITVGARRPGFVEVLSGLEENDSIVVRGTNRVRPGAKVRIVERTSVGDAMQAPGA